MLLAGSFMPFWLPACTDEPAPADGNGGASLGDGSGGTAASTGGGAVGGNSIGGTGGSDTIAGGGTGGTGGTGGSGGSGGSTTCPLPSSFEWTSTGPLATPDSPDGANWVSLKDFTITQHDGQYVVYATVHNSVPEGQPNRGWQGVHLNFDDFDTMDSATQTFIPGMVAPTLFYFSPKDIWVLAYQWGFQYRTSTNPSDPNSWSGSTSLLSGNPTEGHPDGTGPIDQTVICDDTDCYLFFAADNGYIYRSSMPIDDFPGTFSGADVILMDEKFKLFEGVQVYSVKGSDEYLMIVEAGDGGSRYFRAFTATDLGGTWTAMPDANTRATPFAGLENVTFPDGQWTNDISHGDIVRHDPSEKQVIDPCNLQFLYQGFDPSGFSGGYGDIPYRPGLLTLVE